MFYNSTGLWFVPQKFEVCWGFSLFLEFYCWEFSPLFSLCRKDLSSFPCFSFFCNFSFSCIFYSIIIFFFVSDKKKKKRNTLPQWSLYTHPISSYSELPNKNLSKFNFIEAFRCRNHLGWVPLPNLLDVLMCLKSTMHKSTQFSPPNFPLKPWKTITNIPWHH